MTPVSSIRVKKRDGREVPFDQGKIADALYRAARAVGGGDRLLSEELASVVALYVEREWKDKTPTIDDISDLIEKVLIETGHARTAKAYILERDRRNRIRASLRVRRDERGVALGASPAATGPKVDARTHGTIATWSKAKIVEALVTEAELPPPLAEEIAGEVERRVFGSGLTRISTTLIRALVDNELFERGHDKFLNRQTVLGLPRFDLDRLARAGFDADRDVTLAGRALHDAVAANLWTQYALLEVVPQDAADLHMAGTLHVGGLAAPTLMQEIDLDLGGAATTAADDDAVLAWRSTVREATHVASERIRIRGLDKALLPRFANGFAPDVAARRLVAALTEPRSSALEPRVSVVLPLAPSTSAHDLARARGLERDAARAAWHEFTTSWLRAVAARRETATVPECVVELGGDHDDAWGVVEQAVVHEGVPGSVRFVLADDSLFSPALAAPLASRVHVDVAQAAFRAHRFDPDMVIASVQDAVDAALSACEARTRYLERLVGVANPREALRAFGVPATAPRHEIALAGLDAACRIVFDQSAATSDRAAAFVKSLVERVGARVAAGAKERRLAVSTAITHDADVLERFGEIDFARHARGRDLHGVAHDGRAYVYGAGVLALADDCEPTAAARVESGVRALLTAPTTLPVLHATASDRVLFLREFVALRRKA